MYGLRGRVGCAAGAGLVSNYCYVVTAEATVVIFGYWFIAIDDFNKKPATSTEKLTSHS